MIDKKQLIEELLECVKDATDTETQITGLSMCAMLMNEVLDEALTLPDVVDTLVCDIVKGTRCKDSFANYRDGVCYVCGGQAN
jgi:hypothetical protein